MKKTYIQPETVVVNLHTEGMIAASAPKINTGAGTVSADEALTKKKESSMWGSGEDEKSGGIW